MSFEALVFRPLSSFCLQAHCGTVQGPGAATSWTVSSAVVWIIPREHKHVALQNKAASKHDSADRGPETHPSTNKEDGLTVLLANCQDLSGQSPDGWPEPRDGRPVHASPSRSRSEDGIDVARASHIAIARYPQIGIQVGGFHPRCCARPHGRRLPAERSSRWRSRWSVDLEKIHHLSRRSGEPRSTCLEGRRWRAAVRNHVHASDGHPVQSGDA